MAAAGLISLVAIGSSAWMASVLVVLALLVALVSGPADVCARRPARPVLLAVAAIASALLPLFGYWLAGRSHPNAIGGLLPWNDAAGYYGCALAVLDGEGLDAFCQRRPAYSLYLAGLLRAAGSELQLALLLQAFLNAAAIFVAAYAALQRWGAAAGLVVIAVLAPFAAVTSVATLTENLGFVLGAAGLVFVLAGAERRSNGLLVTGVFMFSVALNARAGAFLVLPLLILWPFLVANMPRGRRWRLAGMLVLAAVAGFVPGPVLVALLGGPVDQIHSNFSYTLYGLAAGGDRWTVTLTRLPDATSDEIYAAAFALIRSQPHLLLFGLLQGFLEYLQRLLIYIPWGGARVILAMFWLWGIAFVLQWRSRDGDRILALIIVGVALSSPVLSIDGDTRVYAATVTIDGLLAARGFAGLVAGIATATQRDRSIVWAGAVLGIVGLPQIFVAHDPRVWGGTVVLGGLVALLARWIRADRAVDPPAHVTAALPAAAITAGAVIVAFALPFGTPVPRAPKAHDVKVACRAGEAVIARLGRDSPVITIGSPAGPRKHWPVMTSRDRFRTELDRRTHLYDELAALPAETSVVFLYDRKPLPKPATRISFLTGPAHLVPTDGGVYQLCVSGDVASGLTDARRILSVDRIKDAPAVP